MSLQKATELYTELWLVLNCNWFSLHLAPNIVESLLIHTDKVGATVLVLSLPAGSERLIFLDLPMDEHSSL